jgi:hypothetical protein
MSGNLRACFVGLVVVGTLSAAPASSNPFTEFFNTPSPKPEVTSPPQTECLGRPGNAPPDGQHWVYRIDDHRKCWFLTEATAKLKKTVRRRAAQDRTASLNENRSARPRQSAVVDARAELPRSEPAEPSQPPVTEFKVADANLDTNPALSSAASFADLRSNQLTPEHAVPGQVDVEQLLAAVPDLSPQAIPMGARIAEAHDETRSWKAWFGVLLMMLGGFSILSSSRTLRHAVGLRY